MKIFFGITNTVIKILSWKYNKYIKMVKNGETFRAMVNRNLLGRSDLIDWLIDWLDSIPAAKQFISTISPLWQLN